MKNVYYTVSLPAVVIFSFATLGLFNMYYFFKNFSTQSESDNFEISSLIKGIFYPLFCFSMLKSAQSQTKNYTSISVKLLFASQLLLVFGASVSESLKFTGFFTFIPLLGVNLLFQSANDSDASTRQFSNSQFFIGLVGCILVICLMVLYI